MKLSIGGFFIIWLTFASTLALTEKKKKKLKTNFCCRRKQKWKIRCPNILIYMVLRRQKLNYSLQNVVLWYFFKFNCEKCYKRKKSKSTKIHSQYHLRPNSSCISWSRLVQACCVHILYITTYLVITNTVFNQSYVCCSSPRSSHQARLHLWLFSQSSWWLVLTDDRLSRASDHTNNFPSTLSLTFLFYALSLTGM